MSLKIAGVDEAGRGALAGPVVSAAVVFFGEIDPSIFKDSKTLSKEKRQELYEILMKGSAYVGLGIVGETVIDQVNILQASLLSMQKAVTALGIRPDEVLIDGDRAPDLPDYKIRTIIRGDQSIPEISAASIIAKQTRDKIMRDYHVKYPQYNFISNSGYGTAEHYQSIFQYGASDIHRKSFNLTQQQRLF
ncbi:ribonuclease HII [Candidatus Margulisiibacteriota bacterium]